MSRASIESSTPSSRDSTWNGKPAPSTYLHKQLDVTPIVSLDSSKLKTEGTCRQRMWAAKCWLNCIRRAGHMSSRCRKPEGTSHSAAQRQRLPLSRNPRGSAESKSCFPQERLTSPPADYSFLIQLGDRCLGQSGL